MPDRRLPLTRSLATAMRWPLGVALTSWRYLWRTTPWHRSEVLGQLPEDAEPDLEPGVVDDDIQPLHDGHGPAFHRSYAIRLRETRMTPEELIRRVSADLNAVAPSEFARFHKLRGAKDAMHVGDEYIVRMPGPWDGPVRVVDVTPVSWRFATLRGHLESGQIEFSARRDESGLLVFEIESWARGGSALSALLYHHLRMSKEIQLHMWTSVLEGVAELARGRRTGPITIHTRRIEQPDQRRLRHPRSRDTLAGLHDRGLNFNPGELAGHPAEHGWRVDDYCAVLPAEDPGPPAPDRSFEIAKQLLRDYEFADPSVIQAIYEEDAPLESRDMLLVASWHGLRFRFGVRVGAVRDERTERNGRPVHVWGWSYRTLQGHVETGQMDYELVKWLETGDVEFRIHVVSRAARIPNPIIRLGFRLFGRREQVRFAREGCERMVELTTAALDRRQADVPSAAERISVVPA
jgi:uncharacterized protein (UPF0548 family)